MNFNSLEFFLFFPTLLLLYTLVYRRQNARTVLLLVASYLFYMSWNWKYAGIMLFSTALDYYLGLLMAGQERPDRRKLLVVVSVATNLAVLGVFKYFNFFMDVTAQAVTLFGSQIDLSFLHHRLLLPVGISFYTFQSLSYTIDVYRREIQPERNFLKFALFVSFFPQLVAGPIVRARDFLPQLQREPDISDDRIHTGFSLIFRGLFKKVIIADMLAGLGVDAVFADPGAFSSITLLFALYGYAFQIYCDFSGYTDIAIGSARILGYNLTVNFNRPYLAENIRDFWARWHISLSTWLRDYLYIPLGGNRGTRGRVRFNLIMTMLLGGLWHGAALNFVIWGLWHGVLLVAARGIDKRANARSSWSRVWNRFATFHLVLFGWLLFRVESMEQFTQYAFGLLRGSVGMELTPLYFGVLALAAVSHFVSQAQVDRVLERFARMPAPVQAAAYALLVWVLVGATFGTPAFIYFQF